MSENIDDQNDRAREKIDRLNWLSLKRSTRYLPIVSCRPLFDKLSLWSV